MYIGGRIYCMKVARHKWLVLEDDDCVHVVPESDIKPHGHVKQGELKAILSDMDCPCRPKLDLSNQKALIVHNSFEQEEYLNELK